MSQLRVLVADDNNSMRAAYKEILETQEHILVVGTATDGQEALDKAIELEPDVVILDVRMPNLDGLAAANRIMAHNPNTGIVLVSAYDDLAFVRAIMHSGAARKAYILKNSLDNFAEFIRVVEAVSRGQSVLHRTMIQSLMDIYHRMVGTQATALNDAEELVLKLMLSGNSVDEIAASLKLTSEQVEGLSSSLCAKLELDEDKDLDCSPQVVQAMVNKCVA